MIVAILVIWSCVLFFCLYQKNKRYYRMGEALPGPKSIPIFGNLHLFVGKPELMMKKIWKMHKEYKRILRLWLGSYLSVLVYDPRDAEIVLKAKDTVKPMQYEYLKEWLGESILISSGEKFKKHKKLIMQSFTMSNLKQFIPIFYHYSKRMVNELQVEVDKEQEFDIGEYLSTCTLDVLLETSLGVNKDMLGQENVQKYSEAVEQLTKMGLLRIINPHLSVDFIFNKTKYRKIQDDSLNVVNPIINKIIEHRKEKFTNNYLNCDSDEVKQKLSTFVDRFLLVRGENGCKFTDKELKDEISTIMFGGHDTTTVSAGFVLSLLACYQECQEKVITELDEIFGDSKRPTVYEDLAKMQYLEKVVYETWRLYPPIPIVGKKTKKDIVLETCVIPAGATIGIAIMLLHRNSEYFTNPDTFNPDNFLPEVVQKRHPCAYIPFSVGARTCIGRTYAMMSVKILISSVLRNYRVFAKTQHKDFKVVAQTVLRRKGGFPIRIVSRNKSSNARG